MWATFDAGPSRVWRAVTKEISAWWGRPFISRRARKVVLEPQLGGRLYEEHGPGAGVLWGTVTEVHPERQIVIRGPLGITGAVMGELRLRLSQAARSGQSFLTARVAVSGDVTEGLRAALLRQWEELIGEHLRRWLEEGDQAGVARGGFNAPLARGNGTGKWRRERE